MKKSIKNVIKGSEIFIYHLTHPEDEFLAELMNRQINHCVSKSIIEHEADAFSICYTNLIKSGKMSIIEEIVPNMEDSELEALAKIAIDENNIELFELLCKSGLTIYMNLPTKYGRNVLSYAYKKQGIEFIKYINSLDLIPEEVYFCYLFNDNDRDALNHLIENTESIDELFCNTICCNDEVDVLFCKMDTKALVEFFIDKIDIIKHKDTILSALSDGPVSSVKWFLDLGISIDSNDPLKVAVSFGNIDLIEFYLQYGLQVSEDILDTAVFCRRSYAKAILNLFLKYNVDFSMLKLKVNVDREFHRALENSGLDKDALLSFLLQI